jgi:arginine decarboxylase
MPGERLTRHVVDVLKALRAAGNPISASDPALDVVKVVR